jgi:hypothetical protein
MSLTSYPIELKHILILILFGYDDTSGDIITSRVRQGLHITRPPLLHQEMI